MTKKNIAVMTTLAIVFILGTSLAQARQDKVTICHVSGGDPVKYTTNTVSTNSLLKHLDHGDLLGSCDSQADTLCDDGNRCTVDVIDPATRTCDNSQPVNCDDGIACTDNNTCDPTVGCMATVNCADSTSPVCDPDTGICVGEEGDHPLGLFLSASGWDSAELYQTNCTTDPMTGERLYMESTPPPPPVDTQTTISFTATVGTNQDGETETKTQVQVCTFICPDNAQKLEDCEEKCEPVFTAPSAPETTITDQLSDYPFKAPNDAIKCLVNQCFIPG